MKLLHCHIENFGSLRAFDYTFQPGLNAIYSPNGGGKSTMAAFIKAMFYGLPADSARARFNERRHYLPFTGGKFGGNLTFEWEGGTYRIERFFNTSSGDDTKVYLNGAPCRSFAGKCIGEQVFGLDGASFERTLFIAPGGELSATGGINARLAQIAGDAAGQYDAQGAIDALERAGKALQSRGGRGRIPRLEERIRKCRAELANIDAISTRLGEKYAKSSAIAAELTAINAEEQRRSAAAVTAEKWARYEDMLSSAKQKKAQADSLKAAYPAGFATDDDLAALNIAAGLSGGIARPEDKKKQKVQGGGMAVTAALSFTLSLVFIIAGIVLMNMQTAIGIAALAAGALFFVATLAIMLIGRVSERTSRPASADQAALARADGVLKKFNAEGENYASAAARLARESAEYNAIINQAIAQEQAAKAYAGANGLTERPARAAAGRSERAEELRRQLAAIDRDISDDESMIEALGAKQAELDSCLEELAECRRKLNDYTAAAQLIARAERELNGSLLKPVGDAFASYTALLGAALGGKIFVDKNFCVTFEGGGELRPDGHLSSGQRAIVGLCFRMALIDNIFGGDQPFVILDDPFTDLDEDHMRRAAGLLHSLAGKRQIVYFYCHNSRRTN